ncbi:hypothetical protein [Microvirga sp. VF16]|uniref:hypothetical protein n=1 Tax=Microvirga sp. VF16 TaxID=2807101 RepID=UPI00193E53ED|nr:hypothetical protein [Microvirga sp. VF16]QRM34953.1 hypothetical protein JO965_42600 [Microvirga sp. VF16]
MDQKQLNDIWNKHANGQSIGSDTAASSDPHGTDTIQKVDRAWERKKGEKVWTEVKDYTGNLDPQKTER